MRALRSVLTDLDVHGRSLAETRTRREAVGSLSRACLLTARLIRLAFPLSQMTSLLPPSNLQTLLFLLVPTGLFFLLLLLLFSLLPQTSDTLDTRRPLQLHARCSCHTAMFPPSVWAFPTEVVLSPLPPPSPSRLGLAVPCQGRQFPVFSPKESNVAHRRRHALHHARVITGTPIPLAPIPTTPNSRSLPLSLDLKALARPSCAATEQALCIPRSVLPRS